jgi:hypothetical protein
VQAFRGRRSGNGLEGKQVRDRACGRGKLEIRSVDNFLGERGATCDFDGLSSMVSFMAAGAAGYAGLGAT